jgi:hypothetical protein
MYPAMYSDNCKVFFGLFRMVFPLGGELPRYSLLTGIPVMTGFRRMGLSGIMQDVPIAAHEHRWFSSFGSV